MESDEAIRRRHLDDPEVRARIEAAKRYLADPYRKHDEGITAEELPEFLLSFWEGAKDGTRHT